MTNTAKYISAIALLILLFVVGTAFIIADEGKKEQKASQNELTLITDTPEQGFQVAVTLARKGVSTTQPNKEVLFSLRDEYAKDADALIASSEVIAVHFQTVAAANNYWRD